MAKFKITGKIMSKAIMPEGRLQKKERMREHVASLRKRFESKKPKGWHESLELLRALSRFDVPNKPKWQKLYREEMDAYNRHRSSEP